MKKQLFLLSLLLGLPFAVHTAARSHRLIQPKGPATPLFNAFKRDPVVFEKSLATKPAMCGAFLKELLTLDSVIVSGLLVYAYFHDYPTVFKATLCVNNVDLNSIIDGYTALIIAASKGDLVTTKLLLAKGANINIVSKDKGSNTALTMAIGSSNYEVASYLISAGADVNICCMENTSPLSVAALRGNAEIVKQLIEAGADLNTKTIHEAYPLVIALTTDHIDIAKMLIEAGAELQPSALHAAIDLENIEIVRMLLERGADPNLPYNSGYSPLVRSISVKNYAIAELLLQHGASTDTQGIAGYALMAAVCCGTSEIFDLLIQHGATIRTNGDALYPEAVFFGNAPMLSKLIDQKISGIEEINSKGSSILHTLARCAKGDLKAVIEILRTQSFDLSAVNVLDKSGQYPIHYAGEHVNCDVLAFLLELGAPVNVTNQYGETPLYIAARKGNLDAVQMLVKHKADKNTKNILGLRPVDIAYANGHTAIVRILNEKKQHPSEYASSSSSADAGTSEPIAASSTVLIQDTENAIAEYQHSTAVQRTVKRSATKKAFVRKRQQAVQPERKIHDHNHYEDEEVFALCTTKSSVVVYKHKRSKPPVALRNIRNLKGTQDWFHDFPAQVDSLIAHATCIRLQAPNASEQSIVDDLGIKGSRGFAMVLPGKIEHAHYDARYAKIDKSMPSRGFVGAFVYLFDTDGACYHRCFHQNRESKELHTTYRPEKVSTQ